MEEMFKSNPVSLTAKQQNSNIFERLLIYSFVAKNLVLYLKFYTYLKLTNV